MNVELNEVEKATIRRALEGALKRLRERKTRPRGMSYGDVLDTIRLYEALVGKFS